MNHPFVTNRFNMLSQIKLYYKISKVELDKSEFKKVDKYILKMVNNYQIELLHRINDVTSYSQKYICYIVTRILHHITLNITFHQMKKIANKITLNTRKLIEKSSKIKNFNNQLETIGYIYIALLHAINNNKQVNRVQFNQLKNIINPY